MITRLQAHRAFNVLVLYAGVDPKRRERFVEKVAYKRTRQAYRLQTKFGPGRILIDSKDPLGWAVLVVVPKGATLKREVAVQKINALLACL